jgi:hypothetical protein
MRNIDRISDAIADLDTQEVPNVKATAEKYEVNRKTLKIGGRANQSQCKRQSLPIASASPTLKRRLL